ncbi:S-adenosyl-L-methionine-dependent methyltransferase [Fennellomyces sp. T-0311]|nr:S-adenosyl-L-methionine-dependent methyltransferase [Fennellomyces sp. T-0311]
MAVQDLAPASAYGDDFQYKKEGRHYHTDERAAYMLPDDEIENDRMHMQHYAVKHAFGGNFDSPVEAQLKEGITVLDSGCGPGTWTIDMAGEYPESKFYGLDISPVFPTEGKPANTEFKVHNIAEEPAFPENYFDFIHQRLLVMGLRKAEWQTVIGNHMKALKPGGWIEMTECAMPDVVNRGPKLAILMETVSAVARTKDLHIGVSQFLVPYAKEAGAVNITVRNIVTPFNHGNKVGELLWKDFRMMYTAMRPVVAQAHPEYASEEAYEQLLQDVGEECKELKSGLIWTRVYAQKAEN